MTRLPSTVASTVLRILHSLYYDLDRFLDTGEIAVMLSIVVKRTYLTNAQQKLSPEVGTRNVRRLTQIRTHC